MKNKLKRIFYKIEFDEPVKWGDRTINKYYIVPRKCLIMSLLIISFPISILYFGIKGIFETKKELFKTTLGSITLKDGEKINKVKIKW